MTDYPNPAEEQQKLEDTLQSVAIMTAKLSVLLATEIDPALSSIGDQERIRQRMNELTIGDPPVLLTDAVNHDVARNSIGERSPDTNVQSAYRGYVKARLYLRNFESKVETFGQGEATRAQEVIDQSEMLDGLNTVLRDLLEDSKAKRLPLASAIVARSAFSDMVSELQQAGIEMPEDLVKNSRGNIGYG